MRSGASRTGRTKLYLEVYPIGERASRNRQENLQK